MLRSLEGQDSQQLEQEVDSQVSGTRLAANSASTSANSIPANRQAASRARRSKSSPAGELQQRDKSDIVAADSRQLQRIARKTSQLAAETKQQQQLSRASQLDAGDSPEPARLDGYCSNPLLGPLGSPAILCDSSASDGCATADGRVAVVVGEQTAAPAAGEATSLPVVCAQLLSLVCALLLLLYCLDFFHRQMTNLLTKILGGERRRSLAGGQSPGRPQQQQQQQQRQNADDQALSTVSTVAQSHSSSTLSLPRNSSPIMSSSSASIASNANRRSSRSSIQSVSAMLLSALTGGSGASAQSSSNNGRSIIAKNKEDTVVIASSSPTIIQKESSDGGTSAGGAGAPQTPSVAPAPSAGANAVSSGSNANADADAELVIVDKTLYESVRHSAVALPAYLAAALSGGSNALAVAAAAASADPSQPLAGALTQLATQIQGEMAPAQPASLAHAPLNTSSTMKAAQPASQSSAGAPVSPAAHKKAPPSASVLARRNEVIRATELLLNALNQGDYDTYTRLCDPHMTSFEPENLGNLIDNMELRRLGVDQARQLQFNHLQQQQISSHNQSASRQQLTGAVAAAAAAAAAASAGPQASNGAQQGAASKQVQQIASAAAAAAVAASLANLSLGNSDGQPAGSTQAPVKQQQQTSHMQQMFGQINCASTLKQHSLLLNPSVYLLGDEAASIAYTKLSQLLDVSTGRLAGVEQSEETRVWHRRDANKWICVHLHRSLVYPNANQNLFAEHQLSGPQTSVALIRSMANQQQLSSLAALQSLQQQSVPLISLNHSSAGASANISSLSGQSTNSSR